MNKWKWKWRRTTICAMAQRRWLTHGLPVIIKIRVITIFFQITHLCFPASFPSIVPEGSYALEVSARVSHLKMSRASSIKSFWPHSKTIFLNYRFQSIITNSRPLSVCAPTAGRNFVDNQLVMTAPASIQLQRACHPPEKKIHAGVSDRHPITEEND